MTIPDDPTDQTRTPPAEKEPTPTPTDTSEPEIVGIQLVIKGTEDIMTREF